MADWPVIGGGQFADELNPTTASSTPTTVSCGANDTKGSWTEIVAVTEHDYAGLNVSVGFQKLGLITYMIDIGIGGSGSEVVIYENFTFNSGSHQAVSSVFIPIQIPAGARISVRGQTNSSIVRNTDVSIVCVSKGFIYQSFQKSVTYGAITTTTEGTDLPVSGTDNTKGLYAEITSATTEDIKHLIIDVCWAQLATSASRNHLIDISVGASGSEQIIISNLYVLTTDLEITIPSVFSLPIYIPAGSRIAARAQQSENDSGYNAQLVLHGLG